MIDMPALCGPTMHALLSHRLLMLMLPSPEICTVNTPPSISSSAGVRAAAVIGDSGQIKDVIEGLCPSCR
jgi:hypothetical protein